MKYSQKRFIGNILKWLGLILMFTSFLFTIAAQHPDLQQWNSYCNLSLGLIFLGALVWLFGAHISGRRCARERYWWMRNSQ